MLPVLDNDALREADRHTIEDLGVLGLVLMENAATGLVDALRETWPEARKVLILCGPGNNGGDGLAAARHLSNGGHDVDLMLLADPDTLSEDARVNLAWARAFDLEVTVVEGDDLTPLEQSLAASSPPDIIVDALLGTGLDRPLTGRLARAVDLVNRCPAPVVAVDVPTGLSGSSARVPGPAIEAELCPTFAALKLCHCLPPACEACGDVVVVDIGIPPKVLQAGAQAWWVEAEDVALLLPHRSADGHKGSFGHLLVVAGARGRGGAASMAARAAVTAGAGLVTVAVPSPAVPVVDGACLEAMTFELPADEAGEAAGPGDLEQVFARMTGVAAGPGMGTGPGAHKVLDLLLSRCSGPLVLDADALNMIAGSLERLAGRSGPTVLTPHPGELARLLGRPTEDVVADRLEAAREAARISGAVVVAKGYRTVIADSEGRAWINPTGDEHLATGGSGDVLTGLIGALMAQDFDPVRASIVGCWLHGRAGELGADVWPAAVPAAELPALVASAWAELIENFGD
ncbi:MAG: NAD(P)H-hydrate dehydratase [Acidobacteria bacterium]|nr:NAD(P)H-hydrate dehydratase [Acidobacteriota bacterium]